MPPTGGEQNHAWASLAAGHPFPNRRPSLPPFPILPAHTRGDLRLPAAGASVATVSCTLGCHEILGGIFPAETPGDRLYLSDPPAGLANARVCMKISVILTTYNATAWLEKVLWGYAAQYFTDFEVVIADDGSNSDTAELISRLRNELELDIQHVWQKDRGFRKCRILNKAILHARYEYLVFSDGDCIPRHDFLAVHAARAGRGTYLSGSYYKLPMSTSETIEREHIESGRCFDRTWLMAHGLPRSSRRWKLSASPGMARWLNRLDPTRCNFKGANGSAWLQDVMAVNGFNEDMHYGGLDREFGVRLANLGIKPVPVRYDAIVLHLDHPRGYRDPKQIAANKEFRLEIQRRGSTRTASGIAELLIEGYPIADHAAARRHLPLLEE